MGEICFWKSVKHLPKLLAIKYQVVSYEPRCILDITRVNRSAQRDGEKETLSVVLVDPAAEVNGDYCMCGLLADLTAKCGRLKGGGHLGP